VRARRRARKLTCGETVPVAIRRALASIRLPVRALDARRFYDEACRKGSATGCYRLGWLDENKAPDRTLSLYQDACAKGSAAACAGQARLLEKQAGARRSASRS